MLVHISCVSFTPGIESVLYAKDSLPLTHGASATRR